MDQAWRANGRIRNRQYPEPVELLVHRLLIHPMPKRRCSMKHSQCLTMRPRTGENESKPEFANPRIRLTATTLPSLKSIATGDGNKRRNEPNDRRIAIESQTGQIARNGRHVPFQQGFRHLGQWANFITSLSFKNRFRRL